MPNWHWRRAPGRRSMSRRTLLPMSRVTTMHPPTVLAIDGAMSTWRSRDGSWFMDWNSCWDRPRLFSAWSCCWSWWCRYMWWDIMEASGGTCAAPCVAICAPNPAALAAGAAGSVAPPAPASMELTGLGCAASTGDSSWGMGTPDVGDAAGVVTLARNAVARLRFDLVALRLGDRDARVERVVPDAASSSDDAPSDFLDAVEPLDGLRRRVRRGFLVARPDARDRLPRRDAARFLVLPFHA